MKPYYQDDYCTVYHGDCREMLPELPKVDLVLTDPPYGINYQSNMRFKQMEKIKNDNIVFIEWIKLLNCNVFVCFCRWDMMNLWKNKIDEFLKIRGCLVWHKACGGLGDLKRSFLVDYEMILYATRDDFIIPGKRCGSIWKCLIDSPGSYEHPTQKPIGIMNLILERFGGETILDPFMGSGTTLRAAKDLQRKAIGIEIEEKYCEIAARRLEQEVLPL